MVAREVVYGGNVVGGGDRVAGDGWKGVSQPQLRGWRMGRGTSEIVKSRHSFGAFTA